MQVTKQITMETKPSPKQYANKLQLLMPQAALRTTVFKVHYDCSRR